MKAVEIVVILALSINFAYTSSINLGHEEAAAEGPAETGKTAAAPGDEETLIIDTSDLGLELWEARSCLPGACNAHCRKLGLATGVCIGTLCQCRLPTLPSTEVKEEAPVQNAVGTGIIPLVPSGNEALGVEGDVESRARRCTAFACAQICRRLGFRYSRCSGSRCICWR